LSRSLRDILLMALPFFYIQDFDGIQKQVELDEDTGRHVVQVLRMKEGEKLNLTDGNGNLLLAEIAEANKKHCLVNILEVKSQEPKNKKITIAISLLKNSNRFEWFLEKATEIGVREIIPLICERTEREKFRHDRLNGICISAMLQSQQCWLPLLKEPVQFEDLLNKQFENDQRFIAHCEETGIKNDLSTFKPVNASTILIGPEGDFTPKEIELALEQGFQPVSLGDTRLRTETAGVVAATLLCIS
jgi:16S rRNA (uracil1498-N3)-methyltransferase